MSPRHAENGRFSIRAVTSVVLPGVPEAAGMARAVVLQALAGHPAADEAALCVSELAANAICHSRSGLPGGTFTVTVQQAGGGVRIAVTDAGSGGRPRARRAAADSTRGRGLAIVGAVSAAWGCEQADGGRVTWCEIRAASDRAIA